MTNLHEKHNWVAVGVMALMLSTPTVAFADDDGEAEPSGPRIEGSLVLELQHDSIVKSDSDEKGSDTYPTVEFGLSWFFTDQLSLNLGTVIEPVDDPYAGEDRFFGDIGGYVEELYLKYEAGPVAIWGGKFNPAFGKAWDETPGVYGTDLAEDYEITEKLGVGISYSLGETGIGEATLSGALYRADRTGFSESAYTKRGMTKKADGGATNTEDLESYAIALDVEKLFGTGINAHAAYRMHAKGEGADDVADEKGFVVGLTGETDLGNDLALSWIAEYADFDNFEASSDDASYFVVGAQLEWNKWHLAGSYTGVDLAQSDDYLFQVTLGREIYDDWTFEVAYGVAEAENEQNQVIGLKLSKELEFTHPTN